MLLVMFVLLCHSRLINVHVSSTGAQALKKLKYTLHALWLFYLTINQLDIHKQLHIALNIPNSAHQL